MNNSPSSILNDAPIPNKKSACCVVRVLSSPPRNIVNPEGPGEHHLDVNHSV